MQLLGLSLLQVLALLGGASLAVVLLYLLRVRRREIVVPFAPLFEELLREQRRERLFGRLRLLLSLLLALLFAAALSFALGDPRRAQDGETGRSLVALVDVSASSQARASADAPTRLDQARRKLHELIADMGPNDRMLIAAVGERVTPLGGLADDVGELHAAADALESEHAGLRWDRALSFALDVLHGQGHGEVVLLGGEEASVQDARRAALAHADVRLSQAVEAEPLPNVGILSFAARRLPLDRGRALASIELYASSDVDREVELVIEDSGHPIYSARLSIPANTPLRPALPTLSGAEHALQARIRPLDDVGNALALDDHAFAVLPARQRAHVLSVGRGDLYLSAALLLDELLDVVEVTPDAYAAEPEMASNFDVVIFDECLPPSAPRAPAIYLRPEPQPGLFAPFEVDGELQSPYFARVNRQAQLLRFTALDDVNIARALRVRTQTGDAVLGAATDGPLLVQGERVGQPFVAFTFAPRESDLVLRVAWPVLLLDAIEGFRSRSGSVEWSLRTDESRELRLPEGVHEAVWIAPDGSRKTVRAQGSTLRITPRTIGVHRLEFEGGATEFAANLGRIDESRTASESPARVAEAPSHGQPGLRRELWPLLVIFGLLWLCLESFAWHRRWVT